jgi:dihydrofolate reductase
MTQQAGCTELAIIVAMTRDRVIGQGGTLPWDLPQDRQLFRELTTGNTVIMGRKTYESIKRPLPKRCNIVLSRTLTNLRGVTLCHSFPAALENARRFGQPVFVIGGAGLYHEALPAAAALHISWVDLADWSAAEEKSYPGFHYVKYLRRKS